MKKNLGYFLLAAAILSGCSNSVNQVEADQVEQITPQQLLLIVYSE